MLPANSQFLRLCGACHKRDYAQYHDSVLGPQGQKRPDLDRGEILMEGTLDAMEKTVAFVKAERPGGP